MDRRAFIGRVAGGFVAAPLAAEAQPSGKVYAIGYLTIRRSMEPLTSSLRSIRGSKSSGG